MRQFLNRVQAICTGGVPSLEAAGMLTGMGKRNSLDDDEADMLMAMHKRYPFMDLFGPLINPKWNKHQRIQCRRVEESAEDNQEVEDMDENDLNPINDPELGELMTRGMVSPSPLSTLRMQACSWGWVKGDISSKMI